MNQNDFAPGKWNAICDRCGGKFKSNQVRKEWTGLRVCSGSGTNDCWEPRHPQDHVRGRPDKQTPAWVRSEPADVFLEPGDVTADDL